MPQLKSTSGLRDEFISDDDPRWQEMVKSGDWTVAPGQDVSIVDPYGHQTVVGTDTLQREQERGVENKIEKQSVVVERARKERLKDETSTVGAFARGVARGPTWGLSDKLFDEETLEADDLHHGIASTAGDIVGIGGSLVFNPEAALAKFGGKALGIGGKSLSRAAHELAVVDDLKLAEEVGSTISSKALLTGKGAETVAEKSLTRSGRVLDEATIVRNNLSDVPKDLIGMDAAALRKAAQEERMAMKAAAKVEEGALQEARVPMRAQVADEVRTLHKELMTERPIFTAVKGADVQAIEGVKDVNAQLAKSFSGLRRELDNPIAAASNPDRLVGHLQMRQAALETLQAKAPEIRATLGNDARALALDHVDVALDQTKNQIAKIQSLSHRNPVSSDRLLELNSGVSARLTAIEAAQEAIKMAPEVGLLERGARAGVFAGATALAHAIPGVGVAAPFVGKWASESIGRTFENLAAAGKAVRERSKQALDAFLDYNRKNPIAVATTATRVLARAKFGDGPEPASGKLADVYKARSAELRSQTMYDPTGQVVMRPEARQAIAKRLAPIATVNPLLADKLETQAVRKVEYVSSKLPRQPEIGGLQIGPDNWKPSDLEMRSFARTVRAVEDPNGVEERLADGAITPEDAEAYRTVYPERFAAMQRAVYEAAPTLAKTLPLSRKISLSIFTGVPLIPALQPNILQVLQGAYRVEPGSEGGTQAPTAQPNFGPMGSLKSSDKPTAAQQREGV